MRNAWAETGTVKLAARAAASSKVSGRGAIGMAILCAQWMRAQAPSQPNSAAGGKPGSRRIEHVHLVSSTVVFSFDTGETYGAEMLKSQLPRHLSRLHDLDTR
jgi:hypothetical protein